VLDPGPLSPERIRPLRRREYERLVELGLFGDERIELLRGALVAMSPQGPSHADAVDRLGAHLVSVLGGRARVRQHSPLALGDDSEPEPDIAVVPNGDYSHEHPASALLVIEVADSSLRKDRELKGLLHAAAGIPEYWIVNLADHGVEIHRAPSAAGYSRITRHPQTETLALAIYPDATVCVGDVLR